MNPFVGVVVDEDSGIVNASLCELPANGQLCNVIAKAKKSGTPISGERRERWCKQIVQGAAEMHSKSFVVGFSATRQIARWLLTPTTMLCCVIVSGRPLNIIIPEEGCSPLNTVNRRRMKASYQHSPLPTFTRWVY